MKRGAYQYVAVLAIVIVATFAFLSIDLPSGPTGLQTFETEAISACGNVTVSDNLTSSISSTGTCLNITASDVNLNCNGFTITYNTADGSGFYGIYAFNQSNITIQNCVLVFSGTNGDGNIGIQFLNVSNSYIRNNTITTTGDDDNEAIKIDGDPSVTGISGAFNNVIYNNTLNLFGDGLAEGVHMVTNISHSLVENNTITLLTNTTGGFSCCGAGILINNNGNNNTVRSNLIFGNASLAIHIQDTRNSLITGNNATVGNFTLSAAATFSGNLNGTRIQNNTFSSFGPASDNQFGISLGSQNALLEGNTIVSYGQDSASGISVSSTTANMTVANNTIRTNGRRGNSGIAFSSVTVQNTFINNTIFTNGTDNLANTGISLSSTTNQQILRNNISTNSTANSPGNPGIDLTASSRNTIDGNTIRANGTSPGATGNAGIILRDVSDSNRIIFNTIFTDGTGNNNTGIRLYNDADANNVTNNNIFTGGAGSYNYGILLTSRLVVATGGGGGCAGFQGDVQAASQAHTDSVSNNNVSNNVVRTNGTLSHGIMLESSTITVAEGVGAGFQGDVSALSGTRNNSVTDNLIADNFIVANGTQSNGIFMTGISTTNNATNNSVRNNNITTLGGNSFGISIVSSSGTEFNNTILNNSVAWINNSAGSNNGLQNTTFARDFGSIRLNGTLTVNSELNVTRDLINITNNTAFLNSSALPATFNTTGFITLYNLTPQAVELLVSFQDNGTFVLCGNQCTLASYTGGTVRFNVSRFTTFTTQAAGGVNLTLTKSDSPDPVNNGSTLTYTILVNVTAGTAVNITLNETYPSQVTFVSSEPTPISGNNIFNITNLTAGQTFQVNITVTVNATAGGLVINNTANLTYANLTGFQFSAQVTENTTVNTTTPPASSGSSGSGGGSGGGGGSGVCYPICRQPGYETLPQCSACPPLETVVEPTVQQPIYVSEPAEPSTARLRPSTYVPESQGYPQEPQRYVQPQPQQPRDVNALAKYSWLWLLLLIALIVYLATRKSIKLDKLPSPPPMPTFKMPEMPKFKTPAMFKPKPEPKIDTKSTLADLKDYENKLRQLREQLNKLK